ncbi:MAG: lipopolysaccharide biosynthesis protein [Syntrophothermus sp.]
MLEVLENLYIRYYKDSIVLKRFTKVFTLDVLVRASNFILLPVYLKLMSKEEFGLYTYLYSFLSLFSLIMNFGLYLAVSKLYHDYKEHERKSLVFTINILLLFLLMVVLLPIYLTGADYYFIRVLLTHPFNYDIYRNYLFFSLIIAVLSFMMTNFFIASENIKYLQIFNFLKLVLVHGVVIYLLYTINDNSIKIRFQYAYLIEGLIILLFMFFYVKNMAVDFKIEYAKKALKIGLPSMFIFIFGLVYNLSDKFILEKYGTYSDMAIYNLGFTLASIISVVFNSFQSVYLPFFFKEKDLIKSFSRTKNILAKMSILFSLLSILIYIGIYFAIMLNLIDKEKYSEVLFILPILLASQIVQSAVLLFSNYVVYFEIVYVGTVIIAILSAVNLGLNLLLIPKYNYVGAAVSTLIITSLSLLFYYSYIKIKYINKIKM